MTKLSDFQLKKFRRELEDFIENNELDYGNGYVEVDGDGDNEFMMIIEAPNNTTLGVDFRNNMPTDYDYHEDDDGFYGFIINHVEKRINDFDVDDLFDELWSSDFGNQNNFRASEFIEMLQEDKEYFDNLEL